ncbi:MAG: hypothetical protein MUC77_17685 [Chromatiaceae bacterium]|nr:hypothetical protein [Chromatiaceae bacterium]
MIRSTASFTLLAVVLVLAAGLLPPPAYADRWEVRREVREGIREVNREKREARRELRRCETRKCARREIREGYREVQRERREARREIRRELRDYDDDRYDRDRDRGSDVLKGLAIGAAVIGIATAVSRASRDDD